MFVYTWLRVSTATSSSTYETSTSANSCVTGSVTPERYEQDVTYGWVDERWPIKPPWPTHLGPAPRSHRCFVSTPRVALRPWRPVQART